MDHIMTYEEYLRDVKKGIVTDLGNSPVTPLLLMLQGNWKTQILYELCIHDTARFGTLKKELPGILIELKAEKNCSDEQLKKLSETALQQINDKKYETELTTAGVRTIYKYGVAFSGKKVEVAVG